MNPEDLRAMARSLRDHAAALERHVDSLELPAGPSGLVGLGEACRVCGVDEAQIHRWVGEGLHFIIKDYVDIYFDLDELRKWCRA